MEKGKDKFSPSPISIFSQLKEVVNMATVIFHDDGTYLVKTLKGQLVKTLSELTAKESREILKRYVKNANRRITNINRNDLYSPAIEGMKRYGGNETFSVNENGNISLHTSGSSLTQLHNAIANLQNFLGEETSSVKGARQYRHDVEERLGLQNTSKKALGVVWSIINKARQVNPVIANYVELGQYVYDAIQDDVGDISNVDYMSDGEIERLVDNLAGKTARKIIDMYYSSIRKAFSKL